MPIQFFKAKRRGFTLVELLVVIAIIGVLSAIVLVSLNSARAKSRDARRMSDINAFSKAIYLYYDAHGRMPTNYVPGQAVCSKSKYTEEYRKLMQDIVNAGFLSEIPDADGKLNYCYYDYGARNSRGIMLVTTLESAAPTADPYPGTCRPFRDTNWCRSDSSSRYYCKCYPY